MSDLVLISHKEATAKQLEEIINIKTQAWQYSFKSQLDWIKANLKDTDIHVLLSSNEKVMAYLNLIELEIKIDGVLQKGYGIGNVCARETGKGWGKEMMGRTNLYLKHINKVGLLFCKDSLTRFYSLNNWKLIEKNKLRLSFNNEVIETMISNCDKEFNYLEYSGKPF